MSTIAWIVVVLVIVSGISIKSRAVVPAVVCAVAAMTLFMFTETGPDMLETVSSMFRNSEVGSVEEATVR